MIGVVSSSESGKDSRNWIKGQGPLKKRPLRMASSTLSECNWENHNNENGPHTYGQQDVEFSFPLRSVPTMWNLCTGGTYNVVNIVEKSRHNLSIVSQIGENSMDSSSSSASSHNVLRRLPTTMNLPMLMRMTAPSSSPLNVVRLSIHHPVDKGEKMTKNSKYRQDANSLNHDDDYFRVPNMGGRCENSGKNDGDYSYFKVGTAGTPAVTTPNVTPKCCGPTWTSTDVPYIKEIFGGHVNKTKQRINNIPFTFCSKKTETLGEFSSSYDYIRTLHHHDRLQAAFTVDQPQRLPLMSCKFCEKSYVSSFALKMHTQTHTLPYQCSFCERAFSRPWLLKGHIRTHTGEKPFTCPFPECRRAFADRSNLRAHLQTHATVKKYLCHTCSKSFSRMSLLMKHKGGCSN